MEKKKLIEKYHAVCAHYAKPEEYLSITSLRELRKFFVDKFYAMKKFKQAYADPNCKNCYG